MKYPGSDNWLVTAAAQGINVQQQWEVMCIGKKVPTTKVIVSMSMCGKEWEYTELPTTARLSSGKLGVKSLAKEEGSQIQPGGITVGGRGLNILNLNGYLCSERASIGH